MPTTIKLKNSVTATNVPSSLAQGEVAINVTDKKVWVGNAATTPVQLLGTGADGFFSSITDAGNLTFTGTGNRITGDFSNATQSNRVAIQTSTTNGATSVGVLPNGTSTTSVIRAFNNSDPTNASEVSIFASSSTNSLISGITGTGTYLPLTMLTGGSERLRIDTSGNVGIGTSSPATRLHVAGATTATSQLTTQHTGSAVTTIFGCDGGIDAGAVYVTTNHPLAFKTNNTERMRIDSSGNLLVGATAVSSQGEKFSATNSNLAGLFKTTGGAANNWATNFWNNGTSGNNLFVEFGTETSYTGRGSITYNRAGGLTVYNTTSDQRLKQNIVNAPSALSKINSVQVRSFDWKETGNHVDFGVIAQELEQVAPEAVTQGEDGENGFVKRFWGVDTSALVPAMIKAIQEQQAIITDLKSRIEALENK